MTFKPLPESVREKFLAVLYSDPRMSPTLAAPIVGISVTAARRLAVHAGYQSNPKHRGHRYPAEAEEIFWTAMRSGATALEAAAAAGMSGAAARRRVIKAGFVPRTAIPDQPEHPETLRERAPLTFVQRCHLEDLLEDGYSPNDAARLLGRHRDTIRREMRRGHTGVGYRARIGQDYADTKRKRAKARKLQENPALLAEVVSRLEKRDSPVQVAGRLRLDYPNDPEMWVSHETIYQALYVQPRGELARIVKNALRTGRIKRKPQGRASTDGRGRIKDMVSISERPAEAEDRAIPGHWEGDLILGSTESGSAIGTLVERTTGFVVLLHLPEDRTAETLAAAMRAKIPEIPEILRRSLTWDQGKEMALHTKITEATGLPIYFADPHSPWQRGTNENTNGLLRQYFPKGTDLSFYGPGWLDQVAAELNARPRKRHGFRTPAEELDRLLSDPNTFVAATA